MARLQSGLAAADCRRAQLEAADVEDVEGDVVALADFAEQVLDRDFAVVRMSGQVEEPRMPSLCSSGPDGEAGGVALDEEGGELSRRQIFREDSVEVGETAVGDPHLLAVEDVVLAVGREHGAGAGVHRVGAGRRLRQRIGGDPFAGGELGQVLLLLRFGAVPDERQRADAGVRAEGDEKLPVLARCSRRQRGGDFVELEAAVGSGTSMASEAELAGLACSRSRVTGSSWPRSGRWRARFP